MSGGGGGDGPGAPLWIISFADMISNLVIFFILVATYASRNTDTNSVPKKMLDKQIGVFGSAWLAIRSGLADLPAKAVAIHACAKLPVVGGLLDEVAVERDAQLRRYAIACGIVDVKKLTRMIVRSRIRTVEAIGDLCRKFPET